MYKLSLIALIVLYCATFSAAQEEYHKVEVSAGYSQLHANGMIGEGELFSNATDARLEVADVSTLYTSTSVTTGNSVFATSPVVYNGKRNRRRLNGFNASAVYNFSKYIGAKFEVSGHYNSNEVSPATVYGVAAYNPTSRILLPLQTTYPAGTTRVTFLLNGTNFNSRQTHYNYLGGMQIKNNSKEKKFKPFAQILAGVSQQKIEFEEFATKETRIFGKDKFTNTGFTMAFGGGIDLRLSKRIDLRVIQVDYNPVKIKDQQILAFQQGITNLGLSDNVLTTNLSTATLYSNNDIRISNRWQNNFRVGFGIVFH